jgi:hypothetical protein
MIYVVQMMKNTDWGTVFGLLLILFVGVIGVVSCTQELDRQAKLTPQQRQAEQLAREKEYKDRRKDNSVFCSPCVGPHIGMDGKMRYGISPFGIDLF